ncbi:MAG TPA: branched-chain amino acid ABC transporter permease [Ruminiclostridium sp.]|nr:branched-chain amino acid ABC transporter permease [Ruminiclostridium sp.]
MKKVKTLLHKYILLVIGFILLILPLFTSQYEFYVVERGVQNAIQVLGLLILIGYSGMMSLGSAALLATGSYTYGILLVKLGISPWLGALLAIIITTLIGTLLAFPSFRLAGPFLVVTTVGFGEIVRILLLNLESLTGGAYGLEGYENLFADSRLVYAFMVVTLLLVAVGTQRISNSKLGLALKSIRQDEVAAEIMGVDVRRAKMVSFALSAMLAGLSGVFLANLTGYMSPDSFTSAESTTYLLMVVMGGMNSVVGAIISSIVITALPEFLRFLSSSRLLVYSLVLLIYLRVHWVKSSRPSCAGVAKKLKINIGNNKSGRGGGNG